MENWEQSELGVKLGVKIKRIRMELFCFSQLDQELPEIEHIGNRGVVARYCHTRLLAESRQLRFGILSLTA